MLPGIHLRLFRLLGSMCRTEVGWRQGGQLETETRSQVRVVVRERW